MTILKHIKLKKLLLPYRKVRMYLLFSANITKNIVLIFITQFQYKLFETFECIMENNLPFVLLKEQIQKLFVDLYKEVVNVVVKYNI